MCYKRFMTVLVSYLVFCAWGIATCVRADSVEDLLNQADSALHNSAKPKSPAKGKTAPEESETKLPTAPKTASKSASYEAPVQAIENPDMERIVGLDVHARDSERMGDRAFARAALLVGGETLGRGHAMEKDEDSFTIRDPARLSGAMIQLLAPTRSFAAPTAPWGYAFGIGFGYFSGDAQIERRGVVDADRSYSYRVFPADAFAVLAHHPKSWLELQLQLGMGADFFYQNGNEEADTLTEMSFGPVASGGVILSVLPQGALYALASRRGIASTSDGRSLAATTLALGAQMSLTY